MTKATGKTQTLILYDGVCALCNGMVRFVLRRDRNDSFLFAPLQSELAKKALERHGMKTGELNTVCVVMGYELPAEQVLIKSSAVLHAFEQLGGVWRFAMVGLWIPRVARDFAYDLVARYRYRIFGKSCLCDTCRERAEEIPGVGVGDIECHDLSGRPLVSRGHAGLHHTSRIITKP
jgi:predicted DCC family thiol-disulfide oxidoreductase YuxK